MGEQPGVCAGPAALLLVIFLLAPLSAFGDAGDFVPTINTSEGDFEVGFMGQKSENTAGDAGTKTTDTLVATRLIFYFDGYVYHPRFIQYLIKDTAGFYDEHYTTNFGGSFSQASFLNDYEIRTKFLAEHPYNLELYKLNTTPYYRETTAESRVTVIEQGAIFNYTERPIFMNLSSVSGENKARIYTSDYRTSRASGSFLLGPTTSSAAYSQTNSSTSLGLYSTTEESSYGNTIAYRNAALDSRYTVDRSRQNSLTTPSLNTENTTWSELFNAKLPWNFSTLASYNYLKTSLTTEATSLTPQQGLDTKTKTSVFSISHKLYDSVRTSYLYNKNQTETTTGDTTSETNSLIGIYTKKVPTEGRFTIDGQASRTLVNQESAPSIVGESYSVHLFGNFTLSRPNIDLTTIDIKVMSDTGALIDLVQGVNYVVEPTGDLMKITIVNLPPEILAEGHPLLFPYSFQATYGLLAANVRLKLTTVGYGFSLALYNGFITPYYNRLYTRQEVLAGSIPGGPQDTDVQTVGINLKKAPFGWVTEYRTVKSEFSPSRALRNTLEYSRRISDATQVYAKAEHIDTVYGAGFQGTAGYTERITNLNATIMENIPRQKMTASLTGYYSQRLATFDTDLYSLTGNLSWKIGLLTVDTGLTLNDAETTGGSGKQTQTSEFFYLTLRRKLF